MDTSTEHIEHLTAQQLRRLPLDSLEDEDIYVAECILELEDNDEISPAEGGFMIGYLGAV